MLIYKDNIQLDISDDKVEKYQKEGFKKLGVSQQNKGDIPKNKSLSKMKVDELKKYATELNINDIDSLTKDELIAVIKKCQNG